MILPLLATKLFELEWETWELLDIKPYCYEMIDAYDSFHNGFYINVRNMVFDNLHFIRGCNDKKKKNSQKIKFKVKI